mmetsp:Transcript_17695/g.53035  ORF Transcript_17695/g.53035 Transcript_17695/m.53035 type:complete len:275 (-) Transcript_17695:39-863(-)
MNVGRGKVHLGQLRHRIESSNGHLVGSLLQRLAEHTMVGGTGQSADQNVKHLLVDGHESTLRGTTFSVAPLSNHLGTHDAIWSTSAGTNRLQGGILILDVAHEATLGGLHHLDVAHTRGNLSGGTTRYFEATQTTDRRRRADKHVAVCTAAHGGALPDALRDMQVHTVDVSMAFEHVPAESQSVVFDAVELGLHGECVAGVLLRLSGNDLRVLTFEPRPADGALQHDLHNHVDDRVVGSLLADLENRHTLLAVGGGQFILVVARHCLNLKRENY